MRRPHLALFDLDRTLVSTHTSRLYTKYRRELGEVGFWHTAQVSYWLMLYTVGCISVDEIAGKALAEYAGVEAHSHERRVREWVESRVLSYLRTEARLAVERHKRKGDELAIVTGASTMVAAPIAKHLGIPHVVATEVAVDERGRFTGKPLPPLCFGEGKLVRTQALAEKLGLSLENATFYTDSITDLPLLERVSVPVAVCPDIRLRRVARGRGYAIQDW